MLRKFKRVRVFHYLFPNQKYLNELAGHTVVCSQAPVIAFSSSATLNPKAHKIHAVQNASILFISCYSHKAAFQTLSMMFRPLRAPVLTKNLLIVADFSFSTFKWPLQMPVEMLELTKTQDTSITGMTTRCTNSWVPWSSISGSGAFRSWFVCAPYRLYFLPKAQSEKSALNHIISWVLKQAEFLFLMIALSPKFCILLLHHIVWSLPEVLCWFGPLTQTTFDHDETKFFRNLELWLGCLEALW